MNIYGLSVTVSTFKFSSWQTSLIMWWLECQTQQSQGCWFNTRPFSLLGNNTGQVVYTPQLVCVSRVWQPCQLSRQNRKQKLYSVTRCLTRNVFVMLSCSTLIVTMPLVKRTVEPKHISRVVVETSVHNELECVSNTTLANMIRQLSALSAHAEDLFTELHHETYYAYSRMAQLNDRVDRLKIKITQLNHTVEEGKININCNGETRMVGPWEI